MTSVTVEPFTFVYNFAFAIYGRGSLSWFSVVTPDEVSAIRQLRKAFPSAEPYAGPCRERCHVKNCNEWSNVKIGGPDPWLPVCAGHAHGRFHWVYDLK